MADLVLYETQDRVATLTLNRPERLNTIVPEMMQALDAALQARARRRRRQRDPAARRRAAPSARATTSTGARS